MMLYIAEESINNSMYTYVMAMFLIVSLLCVIYSIVNTQKSTTYDGYYCSIVIQYQYIYR